MSLCKTPVHAALDFFEEHEHYLKKHGCAPNKHESEAIKLLKKELRKERRNAI